MTNNKQSIKLYTEEQLIKMIEKSRITGLTAKFLILTTTPIELPSDEEIHEQAKGHSTFAPSFIYGAEWMRNKITGGNK